MVLMIVDVVVVVVSGLVALVDLPVVLFDARLR